LEGEQIEGAECGLVVDVQTGLMARWSIVPHGDSLISACNCGFALADGHLVIARGGGIAGLLGPTADQKLSFLAPVLDFLFDPSRSDDSVA
jgi:hypothetical protein